MLNSRDRFEAQRAAAMYREEIRYARKWLRVLTDPERIASYRQILKNMQRSLRIANAMATGAPLKKEV